MLEKERKRPLLSIETTEVVLSVTIHGRRRADRATACRHNGRARERIEERRARRRAEEERGGAEGRRRCGGAEERRGGGEPSAEARERQGPRGVAWRGAKRDAAEGRRSAEVAEGDGGEPSAGGKPAQPTRVRG